MRKILLIVSVAALMVSCGGKSEEGDKFVYKSPAEIQKEKEAAYDPKTNKGIGEIKEVKLTTPLDQNMVKRGKEISEMKCTSCHSLGENRIVGPGWKGITSRRTPEWIMNMITNVDVMLEKDLAAQKLLEECLVRMPNQGLSVGDARDVLEFMRHLDQEK